MTVRPRLVLVHGSVRNGPASWSAQAPLGERFELVVLNRPGFPPGPPAESVDFEEHAAWVAERLQPGDHLAGHSYGGIVSLFAASYRPDAVRSLTVIEPPCFGVARGEPGMDGWIEVIERYLKGPPPREPRAFLVGFYELVSGTRPTLPDPLPPDLEQGTRMLMIERLPTEAVIPFDRLGAPYPKLVVSGDHHPAFERTCDVLEERLDAERLVFRGSGHSPHAVPGFNEAFAGFLDWAG